MTPIIKYFYHTHTHTPTHSPTHTRNSKNRILLLKYETHLSEKYIIKIFQANRLTDQTSAVRTCCKHQSMVDYEYQFENDAMKKEHLIYNRF